MRLCLCREITLLKEHARDWRFSTKRVVSELPEIAGGDYYLLSDGRQAGGGQLLDTGKARSARKAWEAAYDTHCGKYASGGSVEMLEDLLWVDVACIGILRHAPERKPFPGSNKCSIWPWALWRRPPCKGL